MAEDPDLLAKIRQMEERISTQLEQKANSLIDKLQHEVGADAVGFGQNLKIRFLDWPSWERYNWPERFPKAEIRVSVKTYVRRIGMTFQPVTPR